MSTNKRYRLRIIVPKFPNFNIYTFAASTTTSAGPIYVATSANKLESWDVEVIDENNLHGKFYPQDKEKNLDHQKLQKERPADIVGFYGSISSTIPRLYELAAFYKKLGLKTVAGGKHVESLPDEALRNHIDVVVFREGELTIKDLLLAWERNSPLENVDGIAFLKNDQLYKTKDRPLIEDFDILPNPDFSLLRYAKMKYFPINRTRGCNSNCEFCAVKDKARCSTPEKTIQQIKYLVETQNARYFFEASDHFAANREEAIEFCKLLTQFQKEYNIKLTLTVQTRITDARYPELLQAMKDANIDTVCIGFESPIDQELLAMKKGYLSKDLINWTNTFHKYNFFIHGMFIFGYPKTNKQESTMPLQERVTHFRNFIKKTKLDTVQVLITIPLPGTELRKRLEDEKRLYPLDDLGWEYYDGQFPLFQPDDGVSPEELQMAVGKMMYKFYHFRNLWKLIKNIIFNFPGIVVTSSFTIISGRVKYIKSAYRIWKRKYFRNYFVRFGGYLIVKNWFKNFQNSVFPEKLKQAKQKLNENQEMFDMDNKNKLNMKTN